MVREYLYLNGQPLSQINSGSPETVTYIHVDHLGTPRFGTNSAGTSVWSWANDAFGISATTGSVTVNLRMAGQYYDTESSLFYNWNRYYNPATGRYISSDPIGVEGGLNTFNYANVNPVIRVDPDARDPATATIDLCLRNPNACARTAAAAAEPLLGLCATPTGVVVCSVSAAVAVVGAICYAAVHESAEEKEKRCAAEWAEAETYCKALYNSGYIPDAAGKGIGGKNIEQCIKGQVTEECGGSPIE